MQTSQLAIKIRDIIAADSDLAAWTHAQFSTPPEVHLGMRIDEPIPPDDYPVVVIDSIRRDYAHRDLFVVSFGCGVVNEAIEVVGNKQTYTGLLQAEDMRELVCDALIHGRFARIDFAGHTGQLHFYPTFISLFEANIQYRKLRRRSHDLSE